MIRLQDIRKCFGERVAVSELTLHVPPGEIYGLLGHNGAGKSTAIGMILGQVWPDSGQVTVCGYDIGTQRNRALAQVGAIFEAPVFYDYLSGRRNLQILSSYTASTPRKKIDEVLEWVGLTGRDRSKVGTYSHGMRARLALAQAMLPNPKLLILDEPGDGLDPEGIHELRQTILRLRNELGLTILLSSHLLSEVEQLCTRIAVLNRGKKVFEGSMAEAKQGKKWVRLRVKDFQEAVNRLLAWKLILSARETNLVELSPGTCTSEIVQKLVESGMRVYEVTSLEQTLEDFYLGLMKRT